MTEYLAELQSIIRRLHGVESTHAESVLVTETFQGRTVWEGLVEVFHLHGHPKASKVYAWTHETDDADVPRRSVTVLHIPPATSPRKAVQVSIASDFREQQANAEG